MLRCWAAAQAGAAWARTPFVNTTSSLAIGFHAGLGPTSFTEQLFMVGLLGGYATFSTFSLQTLEIAQAGLGPAPCHYLALFRAFAGRGVLEYACGAGPRRYAPQMSQEGGGRACLLKVQRHSFEHDH